MLDNLMLAKFFAVLFVIDLVACSFPVRALRERFTRRRARAEPAGDAGQPLRQMRFHAAEYALKVTDRVTLSCRADEIWEDAAGLLVPVETKTRATTYPGDLIELSAVGYALRHQTDPTLNRPIAPYGYVRLVPAGAPPRLVRVTLLSGAQVERLISRYVALRCGLAIAMPEPSEGKCRRCAFGRQHCPDSLCG